MSLVAGTRLGPYEVLELIGAGGMGEVYQARDTRLERSVAIKVLPADLAADVERRARFEREARTISTLNHPHICALYDVGDRDGVPYLVMEHLAGETLAERLTQGPLPLEQALDVGAQIAEALDAAHKHSIVHRDLKPANVILTKTGAKLLDFGLAKLRPDAGVRLVRDSSATVAQGYEVTAAGTLVGTLPYMAPEQVEGREADARTDLWALGCLLHEMVTGQRAFEGATPGSLVGAILAKEPAPLGSRQPLTPPGLERLVKRCLAKDPDQRWDSAHDVADELRWIAQGSAAQPMGAVPAPRRRAWLRPALWALWLLAAAVAGGIVVARFGVPGWGARPAPAVATVAHVSVFLPSDAPFWLDPMGFKPSFSISPDGTAIAYTCARGESTQICVRRLDRDEAAPMPGTENGRYPVFSPDGRSIVFCVASPRTYCDSTAPLKTLSTTSVRVDTLGTTPDGLGSPMIYSWTADGQILLGGRGGIWSLPASGGAATALVRVDPARGELSAGFPAWLPGNRQLMFGVRRAEGEQLVDEVRVLNVASGEQRVLLRDARNPLFLPTGHLLYVHTRAESWLGVLTLATFDPVSFALGPPVPLWEKPRLLFAWWALDVSANGTLLYLPAATGRLLTWVDRHSRSVAAFPARGPWQAPRLSPDGRRIAVEVAADPSRPGIAVVDLDRGTVTDIAPDAMNPIWTPDGARITFLARDPGSIKWQVSDGSGSAETLFRGPVEHLGSWSPDGRVFMFVGAGEKTAFELLSLSRQADDWAAQVFHRPGMAPRFSPDGRWVAYFSPESGKFEVYVRAYPRADQRVQISVDGGYNPAWSADGRELFYRNGDSFYAVPVKLSPAFSAGAPRLLFSLPLFDVGPVDKYNSYDVSPDGQRFLMLQVDEEERRPRRMNLVHNWYEEVKAKVPTRQ